jgi:hypothetical protein
MFSYASHDCHETRRYRRRVLGAPYEDGNISSRWRQEALARQNRMSLLRCAATSLLRSSMKGANHFWAPHVVVAARRDTVAKPQAYNESTKLRSSDTPQLPYKPVAQFACDEITQ